MSKQPNNNFEIPNELINETLHLLIDPVNCITQKKIYNIVNQLIVNGYNCLFLIKVFVELSINKSG